MPLPFENLIATKATGKAQSQSGPQQSNILGQAVKHQAQKQIGQIQQEGQLAMQGQQAQRDAIQEEGKIQQRALQFQEAERKVSDMEQVQGLLQKAEFSELDLENRQDALGLEIAAHKLMMQDQSYVHQLREVGRRRRLTDDLAFNEELDRTVYGEELDMLLDELGWKEAQGALARSRAEELYNMDVNTALAIAAADTRAANTQAIGTGVVDIGKAYASTAKPTSDKVKVTKTQTLTNEKSNIASGALG